MTPWFDSTSLVKAKVSLNRVTSLLETNTLFAHYLLLIILIGSRGFALGIRRAWPFLRFVSTNDTPYNLRYCSLFVTQWVN